jgi:hypothetical protein
MSKIKWSDLPEEIRSSKIIKRSELPDGFPFDEIPDDVTVLSLEGEARERALAHLEEVTREISADLAASGGTKDDLDKIYEEVKQERRSKHLKN